MGRLNDASTPLMPSWVLFSVYESQISDGSLEFVHQNFGPVFCTSISWRFTGIFDVITLAEGFICATAQLSSQVSQIHLDCGYCVPPHENYAPVFAVT